MEAVGGILGSVAALLLIVLASREIGIRFRRIKLPLISGFLLCGVLAGPDVLALLSREAVGRLRFVDEVAIAFIGFAAGAELYLKEFADRIRPILWVTLGITATTFTAVSVAFWGLSARVPGVVEAGPAAVVAAALLAGSILVARSPSSAIAIIKELRAWGPFTRLTLGVTVVMDAVVIVLFTVNAELGDLLLHGGGGGVGTVAFLLLELSLSLVAGLVVGQILRAVLAAPGGRMVASSVLVLSLGWGVFALARAMRRGVFGLHLGGHDLMLEPLLVCMVAGLVVTNFTTQRTNFHRLLDRDAPLVFVVFFTLAGASMSLEVLARTWAVALALFGVRLVAIMIGAFVGGVMAGEPPRQSRLLWMSFVTQAGVGLGLAKEVAIEFPGWGGDLSTVIIAVIVLNQLVGPPLYRWVLKAVEEAHPRADAAGFDGVRDAIVFGHEGQAMALARQLHENGWNVHLAAMEGTVFEDPAERGLEIHAVDEIDVETLERLDAGRAECIVALLDDDANYRICELAYEHYGTEHLIVRAQKPNGHQRFHDLGAVVVDPSTAMISLLDHLVRSPRSTSLLLGYDQGRDVTEIQVGNPNFHGMRIRELVLPEDSLVLSLRRGSHSLITHGDTRLKIGDWISVVGGRSSLDEIQVRFEGEARRRDGD
jgi:Trk K+ transport system NAD-binding subunit/Kef-type K+ transport system membrane component KefB